MIVVLVAFYFIFERSTMTLHRRKRIEPEEVFHATHRLPTDVWCMEVWLRRPHGKWLCFGHFRYTFRRAVINDVLVKVTRRTIANWFNGLPALGAPDNSAANKWSEVSKNHRARESNKVITHSSIVISFLWSNRNQQSTYRTVSSQWVVDAPRLCRRKYGTLAWCRCAYWEYWCLLPVVR